MDNEMTLVFDFETSDNAKHKLPFRDPSQPKPVQFAGILYDESRAVVMSFCAVIKPAGWKIQPGAMQVHGITQEYAEQYGLPHYFVALAFRHMVMRARRIVTFNTDFDFLVADHWFDLIGEQWRHSKAVGVCSMKSLTDIIQLPSKYGHSGYGWPSLDQAFEFIVGTPRIKEGSHDAMKDTLDAAQVYFGAMDKGYITEKNFQNL